MMMKRSFSIAIILAAMALPAGCHLSKAGSTNTASEGLDPVNKIADGPALRGYDAAAYFQEGKPVEGSTDFAYEWNGAKWRFSSAANRDLFAGQPQKYAPQFGGYCSYAVSRGYTANGDPRVWKIVNGKLYLNYNEKARSLWEENIPQHIKQGDENWPRFLQHKPERKD
jgi:YHS domain-containing protein